MIHILPLLFFCVALSFFRVFYTGNSTFFFLNWNLFLAAVPYMVSSIVVRQKGFEKTRLIIGTAAWLLFFPNAPYLVTDLMHLSPVTNNFMRWYDLVLIFSYTWLALSLGFRSALQIETLIAQKTSRTVAALLMSVLLFISAFGVHLGRYHRWNSWDLFHRPFELLSDVGAQIIDPISYSQTWTMTLLFGMMLNFIYLAYKAPRIQ